MIRSVLKALAQTSLRNSVLACLCRPELTLENAVVNLNSLMVTGTMIGFQNCRGQLALPPCLKQGSNDYYTVSQGQSDSQGP